MMRAFHHGMILWSAAGKWLDAHPDQLGSAHRIRSFHSGAIWMREVMLAMNHRLPPMNPTGWNRSGHMKYLACLCCGLIASAILYASVGHFIALIIAFPIGFYLLEARLVFVFPERLRGSSRPWAVSNRLIAQTGGVLVAVPTVIPIAFMMVAGLITRAGLRRAWIQGCVAILIWHKEVRSIARDWTSDPSSLRRLELGSTNAVLLREEWIKRESSSLRMLWISDLHWRGDGDKITLLALLKIIRFTQPDVCVLGGDFVESAEGLTIFDQLIKRIRGRSACIILPGNHDKRYLAELNFMCSQHKALWLPQAPETVIKGVSIGGLNSKNMDVCCVHDPAEVEYGATEPTRVVIAGHLHGGQIVIRSKHGSLYPASWFYPLAVTRMTLEQTTFIVSRGLGDTLPLRWNCPREAVLIHI